ncbi:MAG: hemerythrin domain-containing protein [Thermodesulfobacteriota bacterium]
MATKMDPIAEFREDHRKVRDYILDIVAALDAGDIPKARATLGGLDAMVGPHFRYEEEHLYPVLKQFLGEYIDQLISEHDGAIDTAKACAALLGKDSLSDEEREAGKKAAMGLLIHVSNCDGLAILSERFSQAELDDLGDKYIKAREANVGMLDWAGTIRNKS